MRCGQPYRFSAQTSISLLAIVLVSCGGKGTQSSSAVTQQTPSQVAVVRVTPTAVNLDGGQSQQFTATVTGTANTSVQWSVNGVAGGNAIVGMIDASGLYIAPTVPVAATFTITATLASDNSKSANATASIAPVSITISPSTITLNPSSTQQFTAVVRGAADTSVTWTVNQTPGGNSTLGTVDGDGLYTAPRIPPAVTVQVTATSHADTSKSASATVTLSTVAVAVSPDSAILGLNATKQFTASVTGNIPNNNTAVSWSLSNPGAGGSISATGFYRAPSTIPSPASVAVIATSLADSTKSASAMVTIKIDNKLPQALPIELGTTGGNSADVAQSGDQLFCCSGTLGSLVSRGGQFFILSNNHVLARSNQAQPGEPISQPGLAEANCDTSSVSTVATLSQAVQLQALPSSTATMPVTAADAAIATVIQGAVDLSGTILDLNGVGQPAPPSSTLTDPATVMSLNETVAKVGSASGLTCSTLGSINATVEVNYQTACGGGTQFTARFENQLIISSAGFSASGDSGSLVITADKARPLALLYAGASNATVATPITDVLNALPDPNTGEVPTIVGGQDHLVACPTMTQSQIGPGSLSQMQLRGQVSGLAASELQRAGIAKAAHAAELLRDPAIAGLDVSDSADDPREAAIVVYTKAPQAYVPHLVDGVRTRVVHAPEAEKAQSGTLPIMAREELLHGIYVKERHASELMSNPAIIGVGVGASHDDPRESAVVVFIERGKQAAVPAEIDGVRTRIEFTDPFRAFGWGKSVAGSCSVKRGSDQEPTSAHTAQPQRSSHQVPRHRDAR